MEERTALRAILCISLAGVLFTIYLNYMEVFKGICVFGSGACTKFLNISMSTYGLAIFLALFIISMFGLKKSEI